MPKRLVEITARGEHVSEIAVCHGRIGFERYGLAELCGGLFEAALLRKRLAEIVVDARRTWLQLASDTKMMRRLERPVLIEEGIGHVVVRVCVIRHRIERTLVRTDGVIDVPLGAQGRPHV